MAQAYYRVHGQVSPTGSFTLENLPFAPGADVEIIVLAEERIARETRRYPLRGKPYTLVDPTAPIAEGDWDILR